MPSNSTINKRIALATGWQHKKQAPTKHGAKLPWLADYWRHLRLQPHWKRRESPRQYTGDLNACQEALSSLSGPEYKTFCCFLLEIAGNSDEAMTASAAQRAEALARALGIDP